MAIRKRGGGKATAATTKKGAFKTSPNISKPLIGSILKESKYGDNRTYAPPKDESKVTFDPMVLNQTHRNLYYSDERKTDNTIRAPISDEEYVKRVTSATKYHENYAVLVDKTVYSNKFSTENAHKNYIKILNEFEKIKSQLKEKGFPEITNEEIRAIAKQHCDDNEREEISHIIARYDEKQQEEIIRIIEGNGEESQNWCTIMGGGKRKMNKKMNGKTNRRNKKTRRTRTIRRRRQTVLSPK
jgi:hypothetical protein